MEKFLPRIMIAAPSSGSGKTTITCALLRALKNRKMKISAFKCGPDYIDTMFHTKVLGINSKNIDAFFCDEDMLRALFAREAADISVIEGVMGYYDGLSMSSAKASSYDIARITGTPVILVVNAKGSALTTAAMIKGIVEFRSESNIKGVILNNISPHTYDSLKTVVESSTNIKVFGFMPRCTEAVFKSRHLGLLTPSDIEDIESKINILGKAAEKYIDTDGIIALSKQAEPLDIPPISIAKPTERVKIGIAYDNAFCFYYKDNIELLNELGCDIVYFSPLNGSRLPDNIGGIILGGGYPELYCDRLSENKSMLSDIKNAIEDGMPCLAECGGFMYLNKAIEDNACKRYNMANAIDAVSYKKDKLVRFGYITLTAKRDTFVLKKGESIKAHEFHYWDSTSNGNVCLAEKPNGKSWECMYSYKNMLCGYPHIFYYSNIDFAKRFTEKSKEYAKRC